MKTTIHHGWLFAMLAFLCTIYGCKPVEPEENISPNYQFTKYQDANYYLPNYDFKDLYLLHFSRFSPSTFKAETQHSNAHESQKRKVQILKMKSLPSYPYPTIYSTSCQALSPPQSKPTIPISSNPPTKKNTSISLPNPNVISIGYPNMQFLSFEELNNPNDIIKQPGVLLNNETLTLLLILLPYSLISIISHEKN